VRYQLRNNNNNNNQSTATVKKQVLRRNLKVSSASASLIVIGKEFQILGPATLNRLSELTVFIDGTISLSLSKDRNDFTRT